MSEATDGPLTRDELEAEIRNLQAKLDKSERISWSRHHKYRQAEVDAEGWQLLCRDLNLPVRCPHCMADVWFSATDVFYGSDGDRLHQAVDRCFVCDTPIRLVITPVVADEGGLMPRDQAIQLAREWETFLAGIEARGTADRSDDSGC